MAPAGGEPVIQRLTRTRFLETDLEQREAPGDAVYADVVGADELLER